MTCRSTQISDLSKCTCTERTLKKIIYTVRSFCYFIFSHPHVPAKFNDGYHYLAHPFDFLPVVDILNSRVIQIEELPTHEDFDSNNKEGNVVPRQESQYDPALRGGLRQDVRPVRVSQTGTSFNLNGNEISWQKYKMRVGYASN